MKIMTRLRAYKKMCERLLTVPAASRAGMKFEYAKARLAIYENCENITWLKDLEFAAWLAENKL